MLKRCCKGVVRCWGWQNRSAPARHLRLSGAGYGCPLLFSSAVFLLMCAVAVVYYAFPNVDQRFRSMLASEVVRGVSSTLRNPVMVDAANDEHPSSSIRFSRISRAVRVRTASAVSSRSKPNTIKVCHGMFLLP